MIKIEVMFEPRDLWIGIYWTRKYEDMHIYICILPMFPIHLQFFGVSNV